MFIIRYKKKGLQCEGQYVNNFLLIITSPELVHCSKHAIIHGYSSLGLSILKCKYVFAL